MCANYTSNALPHIQLNRSFIDASCFFLHLSFLSVQCKKRKQNDETRRVTNRTARKRVYKVLLCRLFYRLSEWRRNIYMSTYVAIIPQICKYMRKFNERKETILISQARILIESTFNIHFFSCPNMHIRKIHQTIHTQKKTLEVQLDVSRMQERGFENNNKLNLVMSHKQKRLMKSKQRKAALKCMCTFKYSH